MAKTTGGRNIVSAVKETLDSVVTPSVRDTILARALAAAKCDELPTEPRALEEFLSGALHDSLVKALGPELGLSVSSELERITAIAARQPKARSIPPQAKARSLPPPAKGRSVPPPGKRVIETVRPGVRERDLRERERELQKSIPAASRKKPSRSTLPSPDVLPPGSVARTDERWAEREQRAIAPTLPATRRVSANERDESGRPSKGGPLPVSNDYPRGVARALGVIGTASVDPSPSKRPTVLLASADPEMLRLFTAWLEMRARVEHASGATALIGRIAEVGGPRTVIVLDGKNPSIRPLTLAALAEEFPTGTTIILWGVQPHLHARMCTISAAAEKWPVFAGNTTTNEIVAQCAKIVG